MSKREGYERHTRNQLGSEDGIGPSWYECAVLLDELERDYGCRIHFIVDPANSSRRWRDPAIWVRARAYHFAVEGISDQWGANQFKGNNGARTMAGAWYGALLSLHEVLTQMPTAIENAIRKAGASPEE